MPSSVLLKFRWSQVFQVDCDRPDEAERVFHLAVAVAPKLVLYRIYYAATSRESPRRGSIRIGYVESQAERQAFRLTTATRGRPYSGSHRCPEFCATCAVLREP